METSLSKLLWRVGRQAALDQRDRESFYIEDLSGVPLCAEFTSYSYDEAKDICDLHNEVVLSLYDQF